MFFISPETQLTVSRFDINFPLNVIYTKDEILRRVNNALAEAQIPKVVKSMTTAMRMLNTFYITQRKRDKKSGIDYLTIKGRNPYDFDIIKTKKSMDQSTLFEVMLSYS